MEIQRIFPTKPLIRPGKVEREENKDKKNPPHSHHPDKQQDAGADDPPLQHIDEVV